MKSPAITKACLLFVLLAVMTTGSASESPQTRQVGGFTAQVPMTPQQAQASARREGYRRIPMRIGVPIASQLRAEDRVVEVVNSSTPFVDGGTNAEREIEGITRQAVAVAVIRVVGRESRLTDTGDFVESTITVQVQSVIKDESAHLSEGGLISFSEFGGEVTLDGKRVIVFHTHVRPMLVGRTYLVPFGFMSGNLEPLNPTVTFELDGQTMKRQRTDADQHAWPLDKRTPTWAIEQVRAKAHLPRRQP